MADTLSRRVALLNPLTIITTGLESLKVEYSGDTKLGPIYVALASGSNLDHPDYSFKDVFPFWHNQLCLPTTNIREIMTKEMHSGGIASHFGEDKTIQLVEEKF